MAMLERGGNAFDAAVAAGFVLQVVEPHRVGLGGDLTGLLKPAGTATPLVVCGQGPAPAAATIAGYHARGYAHIPGAGLLATVIPGAFDAWMLVLQDYGRLSLAEVLAPAIHYAAGGHPVLAQVSTQIAKLAPLFRTEWPSSGAVYLPGGTAPAAGSLLTNPDLAHTYQRLVVAGDGLSRDQAIAAARRAWSHGFVAEAIGAWLDSAEVLDISGHRQRGLLTADDLAGFRAHIEPAVSHSYQGWQIYKVGPWSQGPVMLQTLALLDGFDLGAAADDRFVHLTVEALKLAFADREAYYGDPADGVVPLAAVLAADYTALRRALIGETASLDLRPGIVAGYEDQVARALDTIPGAPGVAAPGVDAQAFRALLSVGLRGDTVHIDAIDHAGNAASITPSGGWLKSSPVIPGLGFQLNSRAQMFYLTPGLPTSLAPGRRPRTTLTPTIAIGPSGEVLALGSPGGDQQEQWQLSALLRRIHANSGLQAAIEAPCFHTRHAPSSFFPRKADPGHLAIEADIGAAALDRLSARGHRLELAPAGGIGRMTAAEIGADGILRAAATHRFQQAYAIAR
jgi:gamma-glutamyltranspeptidase/glutathione hydrolase